MLHSQGFAMVEKPRVLQCARGFAVICRMNRIALLTGLQRHTWLMELPEGGLYQNILDKLYAGESIDHYFESEENAQNFLVKLESKNQKTNVAFTESLANLDLPENTVASIQMKGVLMMDDFCGSPGTMSLAKMVKELSANANVATIIFDINSPGGQANGVKVLADAIKQSSKRTVAYIEEGMAASGAYWVASACDEIVLSQALDEVGSIGAMTQLQFLSPILEKQGAIIKTVYAKQSTEKNYETEQAKQGNFGPIEEKLTLLAQSFIDAVKTNRSVKQTKGKNPFAGGLFYGKDAVGMGLIDAIMPRDEFMARELELSQKPAAPTTQSNQSIYMKQFAKVNALLGVEEMQASDEGVYLNETQMEAIDTALAANETAISAAVQAATESATAELATAKNAAANAEASATANAALLTAMCEKFGVVKGESAEATAANLQAHIETLTAKPGATVATLQPQVTEGGGAPKGVDWGSPFYREMGQNMHGDPEYFIKKNQNKQ